MENQSCLLPIGRLENVDSDVAWVNTHTEFEVIDIMGDKEPYLTLLGIDWAYENYTAIDLKKELMIFEACRLRVIQPSNPYQGPRFIEPADDKDERGGLDKIYTLTVGKREDYINITTEGSVSWKSI